MSDFLERLRQKSDIQKKGIAFIVAATVSVIILVTWIATFSFDASVDETADTFVGEANLEAPMGAIRAQLGNLREAFSSGAPIEQ